MTNFLERLVNADKRTLAKIEKKAEEVMALAEEVAVRLRLAWGPAKLIRASEADAIRLQEALGARL